VYDGGGGGGIYEGPVGITTRDRYKEWRKNQSWKDRTNDGRNFFDMIFDN
jgi:hypothetical protein